MPAFRDLGPLETERLFLRPQRVEDAVVFHRLWTERDPRVPAHRRIDVDGRPSVQDVAADTARDKGASGGLRLLTVTLRPTGQVLGYCGLLAGDVETDPELAYELLQEHHGHGYATEAASVVVGWSTQAGFRRLRAGVWDWNVASRRFLRKLGFSEVGRVEPRSEHDYSLRTLREEPVASA